MLDKVKVAKNVITGCILFAKVLQMPQKRTERLNFYCPEHSKRAKDMRHTETGKRKAGIRTRGGRKR